MCHYEKHVSDWQCANFVILKPHVKYKILKHSCAKRPSVRPSYCICLFFSNECRATSKCNEFKKTYCCLPSIWPSLHSANLKHVSDWYIFRTVHNIRILPSDFRRKPGNVFEIRCRSDVVKGGDSLKHVQTVSEALAGNTKSVLYGICPSVLCSDNINPTGYDLCSMRCANVWTSIIIEQTKNCQWLVIPNFTFSYTCRLS